MTDPCNPLMSPLVRPRGIFSHGFVLLLACAGLLGLAPATAFAQRQMEALGRGMIAVRPTSTQAYVGWRLLGDDPANGKNLAALPCSERVVPGSYGSNRCPAKAALGGVPSAMKRPGYLTTTSGTPVALRAQEMPDHARPRR